MGATDMPAVARGRTKRSDVARWVAPLSVFVISCIYYGSYWRSFINMSDEGFLVNGAMRVLDGQVPVTDFWAYPPGRYWLLAALFQVFGVHLTVERFMLVVLLAVRNALVCSVGRRLLPTRWALAVALTVMLVPGPWHKMLYSVLMFAHLELLFRYIERPCIQRIAACGLWSGLALYFRQDFAVFAGVIGIMTIFVAHVLRPRRPTGGAPGTPGPTSHVCVMVALAVVSVIPLGIYYANSSDPQLTFQRFGPEPIVAVDVVHEFVGFSSLTKLPGQLYAHLTNWPNPWFLRTWLTWFAVVLPGVMVLLCGLTLWKWRRGRRIHPRQAVYFVVLFAWSLCAALKIYKQPTAPSFLMAGQGMILIAAVLLHTLWLWSARPDKPPVRARHLILPQWPRPWRRAALGVVAVLFALSWASFLTLTVVDLPRINSGSIAVRSSNTAPLVLPRATLHLPAAQARTLENLVHHIQEHTGVDDTLFAYRQSMIYFLSQRRNATSFDNIVTPMILESEGLRMGHTLRTHPPALQVVDLSERWTLNLLEQYPDDLRDALFAGYEPGTQIDHYLILTPSADSHAWQQVRERFDKKRN